MIQTKQCLTCGKIAPFYPSLLCRIRLNKYNQCQQNRKKLKKKNNICVDCSNPAMKNRIRCPTCLYRQKEKRKLQTWKRRDSNKCIHCGMALHSDFDKGMVTCSICREKRNRLR